MDNCSAHRCGAAGLRICTVSNRSGNTMKVWRWDRRNRKLVPKETVPAPGTFNDLARRAYEYNGNLVITVQELQQAMLNEPFDMAYLAMSLHDGKTPALLDIYGGGDPMPLVLLPDGRYKIIKRCDYCGKRAWPKKPKLYLPYFTCSICGGPII